LFWRCILTVWLYLLCGYARCGYTCCGHAYYLTTGTPAAAHRSDLEAHKLEEISAHLDEICAPGDPGGGAHLADTPASPAVVELGVPNPAMSPAMSPPAPSAPASKAARTRLSVRRNLADTAFVPAMDAAARALAEGVLRAALDSLPPELQGTYTPLTQLGAPRAATLRAAGLLAAHATPAAPDPATAAEAATDAAEAGAAGTPLAASDAATLSRLATADADAHAHAHAHADTDVDADDDDDAADAATADADAGALTHRGVWVSASGDLACLVNYDDHLELVAVAPGAAVRGCFEPSPTHSLNPNPKPKPLL